MKVALPLLGFANNARITKVVGESKILGCRRAGNESFPVRAFDTAGHYTPGLMSYSTISSTMITSFATVFVGVRPIVRVSPAAKC